MVDYASILYGETTKRIHHIHIDDTVTFQLRLVWFPSDVTVGTVFPYLVCGPSFNDQVIAVGLLTTGNATYVIDPYKEYKVHNGSVVY